MSPTYSVRFEDVVQRFRVIQERHDTLREAFARIRRSRTTYHEFEAVAHVSFEVSKGEVVGIIGRVEDYQRGNPADVPAAVLPGEMHSTTQRVP